MNSLGPTAPESVAHLSERRENLALLYQGILTAIVRVQSGRQSIGDSIAFRKGMQDVFEQVAREAARSGYEPQDLADSNYAVVAFLDEAVLNSNDPGRTQWRSLQAEIYQKAVSGEEFFDRLNGLKVRRDSIPLSDVLEVYYLCLLLGYRGRYSGETGDSEIKRCIDELGRRIRSIRGTSDLLSPLAIPATLKPSPMLRKIGPPPWLWPVAIAVFTTAIWIIFRLILYFQAVAVRDAIEKAAR